jgi:hypothetical protein
MGLDGISWVDVTRQRYSAANAHLFAAESFRFLQSLTAGFQNKCFCFVLFAERALSATRFRTLANILIPTNKSACKTWRIIKPPDSRAAWTSPGTAAKTACTRFVPDKDTNY